MKPLRLLPEAEAELDEAIAYYEERKTGLGIDFRSAVEQGLARIQEHPLRWSPYNKLTRRFLVRRFPFSIIYLEEADALVVIAIAHQKRRPGYWRHRL